MSTPLSSILHDRSKNIDTRYHSIREFIIKKEVQLKFVKPQGQIIDIFTTIPLFQNIGIRVQIVDIFNYNNPNSNKLLSELPYSQELIYTIFVSQN